MATTIANCPAAIYFNVTLIDLMPACAVADLGPVPSGVTATSPLSAWTTGWPDGGPQWVAQPLEDLPTFKARIIAGLQASANTGVIVYFYQKTGFFVGQQ